ncbi:MAG: glycosyltransferase family 4 protein, partial [Deltaproteobacteria bacterium]|nr:glycosyltransferase family 4 protein [Deltaproteobacteria bacterium]
VLAEAPDIVISFMDTTNVRSLIALTGSGVPVIISERTDPRYHDIGSFWPLARRLIYPCSAALVVQTRPVAGWGRGIVPARKVTVIPNFVRTLPDPKTSTRDKFTILSVGRLGREKGYDILLSAFAEAGGSEKGWHLTILGEGNERDNLERLVGDRGLTGSVSLPGIVREPAEWMQRTCLFVLSSRFEGFPNALLEAMACGCAVIAADCPSAPAEIIHNGINGLLVPAENVRALGDAMLRLMDDEDLRQSLGTQALEVKTVFSQESIMGLWDALIEKVLHERDSTHE